mmetsp:Transcript_23802/g.51548  ORF Transcript_23802/g.51548 Transcript_23802/m.51548 type:complete len:149 (+) Transcript_23802:268-714(+)
MVGDDVGFMVAVGDDDVGSSIGTMVGIDVSCGGRAAIDGADVFFVSVVGTAGSAATGGGLEVSAPATVGAGETGTTGSGDTSCALATDDEVWYNVDAAAASSTVLATRRLLLLLRCLLRKGCLDIRAIVKGKVNLENMYELAREARYL